MSRPLNPQDLPNQVKALQKWRELVKNNEELKKLSDLEKYELYKTVKAKLIVPKSDDKVAQFIQDLKSGQDTTSIPELFDLVKKDNILEKSTREERLEIVELYTLRINDFAELVAIIPTFTRGDFLQYISSSEKTKIFANWLAQKHAVRFPQIADQLIALAKSEVVFDKFSIDEKIKAVFKLFKAAKKKLTYEQFTELTAAIDEDKIPELLHEYLKQINLSSQEFLQLFATGNLLEEAKADDRYTLFARWFVVGKNFGAEEFSEIFYQDGLLANSSNQDKTVILLEWLKINGNYFLKEELQKIFSGNENSEDQAAQLNPDQRGDLVFRNFKKETDPKAKQDLLELFQTDSLLSLCSLGEVASKWLQSEENNFSDGEFVSLYDNDSLWFEDDEKLALFENWKAKNQGRDYDFDLIKGIILRKVENLSSLSSSSSNSRPSSAPSLASIDDSQEIEEQLN